MDISVANIVLNLCDRFELHNHAFGDTEITWQYEGLQIGGGFFNDRQQYVWVRMKNFIGNFLSEDADRLRRCGTLVKVSRNESVGPATYMEGLVMRGLSNDDVKEELTGG